MAEMKLRGIELLVFDLDGTLIDSKTDISNSINETLKSYDLPLLGPDLIWSYLGDGASFLVDKCFNFYRKNVPEGAIEFFVDHYAKHCIENTKLYPDVVKVLRKLGNFKKAILTNKTHEITVKICEELKISHFFEFIVGGGEFKKKPDPEGLLKILEFFKTAPENAVIIGDTTIDLLTGKRAAVKRIAVTWGVHKREVLEESNPDAIIDNIKDLPAVLF